MWISTGRPLLLLHSAYGLRPAIRDAQARLTAAGFLVDTSDLYGGQTANRLDDVLALRNRLDRTRVLWRAHRREMHSPLQRGLGRRRATNRVAEPKDNRGPNRWRWRAGR